MKKQVKKLVLSKETVGLLEVTELRGIAGASVGSDCQSDPWVTWFNSCGSYCQPELTGDGC